MKSFNIGSSLSVEVERAVESAAKHILEECGEMARVNLGAVAGK